MSKPAKIADDFDDIRANMQRIRREEGREVMRPKPPFPGDANAPSPMANPPACTCGAAPGVIHHATCPRWMPTSVLDMYYRGNSSGLLGGYDV